MSIMVCQRVPDDHIRNQEEEMIPQIEEWFVANPKRKICKVQWFYNKSIDVRRGRVAEKIHSAADVSIFGFKVQ